MYTRNRFKNISVLPYSLPKPPFRESGQQYPVVQHQVRQNATRGDRLTEGVASKLQFLTSKNYTKLFSELSEAATAYEIAKDQDGAKVNQHGIDRVTFS